MKKKSDPKANLVNAAGAQFRDEFFVGDYVLVKHLNLAGTIEAISEITPEKPYSVYAVLLMNGETRHFLKDQIQFN